MDEIIKILIEILGAIIVSFITANITIIKTKNNLEIKINEIETGIKNIKIGRGISIEGNKIENCGAGIVSNIKK